FAVGDSGDRIDLGFFGADPFASGRFRIVQAGADTWIQEIATEALYVQLLNVNASALTPYNLSGLNPSNVRLIDGTGDDVLTGTALSDILRGFAGDDVLNGGDGSDQLAGGLGNDLLYVDGGDLVFEGAGEGRDNVLASAHYVLNAGAEVELLSTTANVGTAAIDLTGNEFGQAVIGNMGANVLRGGGGVDVLVGLGGNDTFVFDTAPGAGNVDVLADFVSGEDRIALDADVFAGLGLGTLPAGAFRIGTTALDGDDRLIYNPNSGALFFDADGNGNGAAIQVATLQTAPALAASDFIVI
ncbi:hypothetical protein RCO27_13490, partial [Sphingosinicella sp. LHD-64]|uniref:calcium-binding protein n=1 Tax=Sphingosinicella sp. LHD-64 TaxID=3072139 RepID=UPI0028101978|nr:hypothetical protein [Sphingosinicella sp. LHD-64]